MQKEVAWNIDLIEQMKTDLRSEFPNVNVVKGKVLKDIFLSNDEGYGNSLQFGFVDQDIVVYEETMDISDFKDVKNIFLHNVKKEDRNHLIIPKVIVELKYNGINSHGLIIYSNYAADIKSIFPKCQYYLMMRYKTSSSDNKLFRHGKNFDKIMYLDPGSDNSKEYVAGQFQLGLKKNKDLHQRYAEFLECIRDVLRNKETHFVKY